MAISDTLLVVAKQPVPGQTKTRLCPPLTPIQAADLYECFLLDTLDMMRKVHDVRRVIGYLPVDAEGYFSQLAPDMELVCQQGDTLGERLDDLISAALVGGSRRVVVIDSDSPTLPAAYVALAFERLNGADVVLGPTHDGGYYLIGMKVPQPNLLRQVKMSTPRVLADTLELAKASGVAVSLLPTWYDVDTLADLQQLESEVSGISTNGATRRWLLHYRSQPGDPR